MDKAFRMGLESLLQNSLALLAHSLGPPGMDIGWREPVSYTHLTLPTSDLV